MAEDNSGPGKRRFDRGHDGRKPGPGRPGGKRFGGPRPAAPAPDTSEGERISKVISRAGVASRRDVERMIAEGRIGMNGAPVTTPVTLVRKSDRLTVDGKPLAERERTRLFLYHKPVGLVTTEKDPEERPTVFDNLPPELPRLVSIGRLDINTEGLLLLTNDGGLARVLEHPSTGWLRRYRVRVFGEIGQDRLDELKDGIEIEGMQYGPVEAQVDREQGSNMWLTLGLREGKNREVKRILEHLGLKVNRLIRISFGPFQLGELAPGTVDEVRGRVLREQLGEAVIKEAGADFSTDQPAPRASRDARPSRDSRPPGRGPAPDAGAADDKRAQRRAEAVAQGRRSAAHRHSWRDAESWAAKTPHAHGAKGRGDKARDIAPGEAPARRHGPRSDAAPDGREHRRGGRIADRKGRSILVERASQAPSNSRSEPPRQGRGRPERTKTGNVPPARGKDDVLRRRPARASREDRPPRRFDARPERPPGERPPRRFDARPERSAGERPSRRFDARPERPAGERPSRRFDARPERPAGERPPRRFDARPAPKGDAPIRRFGVKPEGGRPARPHGERPRGPEGGRDARPGKRPFGNRPSGNRPSGDRPSGGRPQRPPGKPRS